ncbi:C45 family peptidase [Streptomyces sp. NPDC001508]|uniref:C45 family peptidase n=1 Tax=Streptomyces sp. NPDC001508 TaxID=3154656 RepID=UPI00331CAB5A
MNTPPADTSAAPPLPPTVRVHGGPAERGRQYGRAAAGRVQLSLAHYERVYATFAGFTWREAADLAERFVPVIDAFDPRLLEEIQGVADGAGARFADILALNLRTEILFSGKARKLAADGTGSDSGLPGRGECTSFCDLRGPRTLAGQNWDWIPFAHGTIVVLEAAPSTGPRWVSVVEAGLLAKFGVNAAGLTVLTNALVTSIDRGEPGMPYHLLLRALLDAGSVREGEELLRAAPRASSANYLLVQAGRGIDVEARPGGPEAIGVRRAGPGGLLVHANHFDALDPADALDHGPRVMQDTVFRRERALELAASTPEPSVAGWHRILADHAGHPDSLCCHPNPRDAELDRGSTVASVIVEPEDAVLHLALGHPCSTPRRVLDCRGFFAGTGDRVPVPAETAATPAQADSGTDS